MAGAGVALAGLGALAWLASGAEGAHASLGRAVASATGCRAAAAQQLRAWQAIDPPRAQPPGADGATVRHWPTATLGTWVVETTAAGATRLTRVAPDEISDVTWATAGCTPAVRTRPRPRPAGDRFTDDDLTSLLAAHPRGAVYVWSPHMPLSLDAVDAFRGAADARGMHVTLVVAPDADPRFARQAADARGWPAGARRVADAVELVFRDALVHAPAVIAYAGGRLRGSPWPGAHTRDEYGAYLDRVLSGAR